MNHRVNSTPKTAVLPVRLCDLNLSDIEDDDDEFDNKQETKGLNKENEVNKDSSHKVFEQIKMKFSEKTLSTPLKHSNVCTPLLQDRKSVFELSSKLNRQELYKTGGYRFGLQAAESPFTIKENEIYSTPYSQVIDNTDKLVKTINKEPLKLAFSPLCGRNTSDISKEKNYVYNLKQTRTPIHKTSLLVAKSSIKKNKVNENNYFESKGSGSNLDESRNNFLDDSLNRITGIYELKNNNEDTTLDCSSKLTCQNAKAIHNNNKNATSSSSDFTNSGHYNLKHVPQNTKELQNTAKSSALLPNIPEIAPHDAKSTSSKISEFKEKEHFKIPEVLPQPDKAHQVQNEDGVLSKIILGKQTYDISQKLGSGGSSEVYLGIRTDTLEKSAIKVVNLSADANLVEGYMNEVELLSRLQGSDVVIKMLNYVHVPNDKVLYMVMECGESDLSHIIKTAKKNDEIPFPIVILVNYWLQMLEAVKFIHDNGIIHSDLKPANFLKVGRRLKLIDFGIASSISNDCTSIIKHVQTGTFNYMSPEALQDTSPSISKQPNIKISFKSDVWSLGCILYLLLYGNTPFGHLTRYSMKMAAITDPNSKIDFPELDLYPPILVKTAKRCLVYNPYDRPMVEELLKLPREPFKYPENNS